jgi:hypothetical protein
MFFYVKPGWNKRKLPSCLDFSHFILRGIYFILRILYAGRVKDNIDSKSAYFHLAAWSLPLVLTTTTLALGEVHADSSSGVCFVGTAGGSTNSVAARTFLLIAPLLVAFFTGGFYLIRGEFDTQ